MSTRGTADPANSKRAKISIQSGSFRDANFAYAPSSFVDAEIAGENSSQSSAPNREPNVHKRLRSHAVKVPGASFEGGGRVCDGTIKLVELMIGLPLMFRHAGTVNFIVDDVLICIIKYGKMI